MNWYMEALRKYAVFDGRARRKEYWYFLLVNMLVITPATIANSSGDPSFSLIAIIGFIYSIAVVIPSLAVGVRRLHDTGRSGWWWFIT